MFRVVFRASQGQRPLADRVARDETAAGAAARFRPVTELSASPRRSDDFCQARRAGPLARYYGRGATVTAFDGRGAEPKRFPIVERTKTVVRSRTTSNGFDSHRGHRNETDAASWSRRKEVPTRFFGEPPHPAAVGEFFSACCEQINDFQRETFGFLIHAFRRVCTSGAPFRDRIYGWNDDGEIS